MRIGHAVIVSLLMMVTSAFAEDRMGLELHEAAAANNANKLSGLIASGHDIEARDKDERTPLLIATRADAIDAASLLIRSGADVNAKDRIADTPFLYAGVEGRLDILKLILATGKAA